MKPKILTILIALILVSSIVYSQGLAERGRDRGQESRATNVELSFGQYDLSSISPDLSEAMAYKLAFIDGPAKIGDLKVKSILLANEVALIDESSSGSFVIESALDQSSNYIIHISKIPFLLYKSDDIDGSGNSGYVLIDSRSLEENANYPIKLEDESRNYALLLYTITGNEGAHAFANPSAIKEKKTLGKDESATFVVTKERKPKELAQAEVDIVLATPPSGCKDLDSGNDEKYKASYSYDTDKHVIYDFCAYGNEKEVLHESYCNAENKVDIKEIECTEGCRDGACKKAAGEEGPKEFCIDTDTLETNPLTALNAEKLASALASKGATVGFFISQESKYSLWEDYCTPDGNLVEYSCKKKKVGFTTVYCACSEGKCENPPYCLDSDGGNNQKASGYVLGIDAENNYFKKGDTCKDEKKLTEYACDKQIGAKDSEIECEFGCSNSRCLAENEAPVEELLVSEELVPIIEEPVIEKVACTSKSDCSLEEACISQECSACATKDDCGSGWKCDSGKCIILQDKCSSDYDCDEGKYCLSAGACEKIKVSDKNSYIAELKKIISRLAEYKKILGQAEAAHKEEAGEEPKAAAITSLKPKPTIITPTVSTTAKKPTVTTPTVATTTKIATVTQPAPPAKAAGGGEPQIMPTGYMGRSCSDDRSCGSGRCENKKCVYKGIVGEYCIKDSNCLSNNCNENTKKCIDVPSASSRELGIGRSCTSNSQCRSGKCSDGICGRKNNADCDRNGDCLSHGCPSNANPFSSDTCEWSQEGELCSSNGDCATNLNCVKHRCIKAE